MSEKAVKKAKPKGSKKEGSKKEVKRLKSKKLSANPKNDSEEEWVERDSGSSASGVKRDDWMTTPTLINPLSGVNPVKNSRDRSPKVS